MKKIVFIADFFKEELPGGGESNDDNLIHHLRSKYKVETTKANKVSISMLDKADTIIIGNFISLAEGIKQHLLENKNYIIYEHDHKYVKTRDPSKYSGFIIPEDKLVNKKFYESAKATVVLSEICKEIIGKNLPKVNVHNIGCSLWSTDTFDLLTKECGEKKTKDLCILKSENPTKNYHNTVEFCNLKSLKFEAIGERNHHKFLRVMSGFERILFIPTVLETFSRLCAEAKMLNLEVMTNKKMIGFFSEEYSKLSGLKLINELKIRNKRALNFFESVI